MNSNKVPEMGGITAEILKCDRDEMINLFEQVINDVREVSHLETGDR